MTRFPLVQEADAADPLVRQIYDEIRTELGFGIVPNLFKSMAGHPKVLEANWRKFSATILQGEVPRTIKEMIGIAISQVNNSQYALQVHLHGLSALGISEDVLRLLIQDFDTCPLPPRDKAVIRFGLLAAQEPLSLNDGHFAELRSFGMNDGEIYELIATADLFSAVNVYTDAIALEIDAL
ncbi:MAG TPA: carboxymuconolactone decarboxylase family protein [Herpetosiphonaceae bacterium]